jgi:hypothetical protein
MNEGYPKERERRDVSKCTKPNTDVKDKTE